MLTDCVIDASLDVSSFSLVHKTIIVKKEHGQSYKRLTNDNAKIVKMHWPHFELKKAEARKIVSEIRRAVSG